MIDYLGLVREFQEKYNHYTSKSPANKRTLPINVIELRNNLLAEEIEEFIEAWTIEDIADSLADILYVTFGAALAYGIPIDEVFAEVHRSNMTKPLLKNEDGKTIKGDGYEPPKIKEILYSENVDTGTVGG